MIAILKSILSSYWLSILKWGAIAISVAAILFTARKAGKDSERVRNMEGALDAVTESNETRREVRDASSSGVIPKRVRKFYLD